MVRLPAEMPYRSHRVANGFSAQSTLVFPVFSWNHATLFSALSGRSASGVQLSDSKSGQRDMLVIMRLPEVCSQKQERGLERIIRGNGRDQSVRQEVRGLGRPPRHTMRSVEVCFAQANEYAWLKPFSLD